ncbi:hypothetical protein GWI33_005590 [Rhynchophorus ferrugineus]|uniref:Uncharacterized protein n=1 Tax=Rhynchophorus ferrugineus TaxID=354439 RepID=A0A834IN07_RHYFE|nr:hypothetical protein GWI33_005590 [Rhynchophorus ferrugineus]
MLHKNSYDNQAGQGGRSRVGNFSCLCLVYVCVYVHKPAAHPTATLPEYDDLDISSSLNVKGMWTFIMFIWGMRGCMGWWSDVGNTNSSP